MNITISGNSDLWHESIAAAGFAGVDLPMPPLSDREALLSGALTAAWTARKARLDALGLLVGQVHLTTLPSHVEPIGDGSYEAYEDCMFPLLAAEIALTAQMGCRMAVMHPFYARNGEGREVSRAGNVRLVERLLPVLERHGVTLALENIYALGYSDGHHELAEDMLHYAAHFDSPYVGICLDAGHAIIRKQDPIELARAFGKHLRALHLHTSLSRCDNHALPCTVGGETLDWPTFCKTLADIGYVGNFNLEVRPTRALPTAALEPFYRLAHTIARSLVTGAGL